MYVRLFICIYAFVYVYVYELVGILVMYVCMHVCVCIVPNMYVCYMYVCMYGDLSVGSEQVDDLDASHENLLRFSLHNNISRLG